MQQFPAPGHQADGDAGAPTTELHRPVGREELELIAASGWTTFPPRRSWQPFFSPLLRIENARKIAQELNGGDAAHAAPAWVVRFQVRNDVLARFELRNADLDGGLRAEYSVPADALGDLNAGIVGPIEVLEAFGDADAEIDDDAETVRQRRLTTAYDNLMQELSALLRRRVDGPVPADGCMGEAQAWASRLQPAEDYAAIHQIVARYEVTDDAVASLAGDLWPPWQRFLHHSGRFDGTTTHAAPAVPSFTGSTAAGGAVGSQPSALRHLDARDVDATGRHAGIRVDAVAAPDGSVDRIVTGPYGAAFSFGDPALARPLRFSRLAGAAREPFVGPLPSPTSTSMDDLGDGVLASWADLLPPGPFRAVLIETDVRQVHPGGDGDYFAGAQAAAWGPDPFWELPHDPRTAYLRMPDTAPAAGIDGVNLLAPFVPLTWADPLAVAEAASVIGAGGRPTCVAVGVVDAHETPGAHGPPVRHLCAVHLVVAGAAALRACVEAGVAPRVLSFVDLRQSGAVAAAIDVWARHLR
jgi:hypothetical protein